MTVLFASVRVDYTCLQLSVTKLVSRDLVVRVDRGDLFIFDAEHEIHATAVFLGTERVSRRTTLDVEREAHVRCEKQVARVQHKTWEHLKLHSLRKDFAFKFRVVDLDERTQNVGALLGAGHGEDPSGRVSWLDIKVADAVHGCHLCLHVEAHALVLVGIELLAVDVVGLHGHVDRLVLLDQVHRRLQNQSLDARYGQNSLSRLTFRHVFIEDFDGEVAFMGRYDLQLATHQLLLSKRGVVEHDAERSRPVTYTELEFILVALEVDSLAARLYLELAHDLHLKLVSHILASLKDCRHFAKLQRVA